jgi:hypothetical protein
MCSSSPKFSQSCCCWDPATVCIPGEASKLNFCNIEQIVIQLLSLPLLQKRTLERLPKLVAKLEESRLEISHLQDLNRMLIEQLDKESAQLR